jgi:curved DNA-binding protein CbpA
MAIDPYRTLGLLPGATPAEVKRAYRRLAKALHPDSAGPGALPRFLALHEAYEQLTTGRRSTRGSPSTGTAAGGSSRASAGTEPWRADPAKARTAREQARTNRSGSTRSSRPAGATEAKPGGGSKRRSTRKATLGSTSYDEARDPSDTTWAGASWYGPTSGEYWRVNPREYADPRKHGPEYQSRARRRSTTSGEAADPSEEPEEVFFEAGNEPAPGSPPDRGAPAAEAGPSERAWATPPRDARRGASFRSREPRDRVEPLAPLSRLLDAEPRDPIRRLGYALLAWAPIGLASAAVIGQLTGCAVYSATCSGAAPLLPWLAQAIILGLLLLVPPLARVLAVGSLAVVLALVPATAFLLAFGGSATDGAPATLQMLLTIVWIAGVVVAIVESGRNRPTTASP